MRSGYDRLDRWLRLSSLDRPAQLRKMLHRGKVHLETFKTLARFVRDAQRVQVFQGPTQASGVGRRRVELVCLGLGVGGFSKRGGEVFVAVAVD